MRKIILAVFVVAMLGIPTVAQAGTLGCLLGAAAGGFGGAQIGSGKGQLATTAIGTLLGCGLGSSIQNSDQQQYQPRYQPQPRYQQVQSIHSYQRPTRRYYQPAPAPTQWQQPRRAPQQVANSCPYSREYQSTVTVGGKQVPAYGTACSYNSGGDWDLGPLTPAR